LSISVSLPVDLVGGRILRAAPALAFLAALAGGASFIVDDGFVRLSFLTLALTLAALLGVARIAVWVGAFWRRSRGRALCRALEADPSPVFLTDAGGCVLAENRAMRSAHAEAGARGVVEYLGGLMAHPAAALLRLQTRAAKEGAAQEDFVSGAGRLRLGVHAARGGIFLWRVAPPLEGVMRVPPEAADWPGSPAGSVVPPVLVCDAKGRILGANPALCALAGGKMPATVADVLMPTCEGPFARATFQRHDGAALPVIVLRAELPEGLTRLCILPAAAVDAAAALTPERADFDALPVALLRLSVGGQILAANQVARALLGEAPEPGTSLVDRIEGLGRNMHGWLMDVAVGRSGGGTEVVRLRRAGGEAFVQIALHPDPGGALIAVLTDATAMKTLEAQFVQSQKMQAIGQLAGGVAHDFNNLLTAISGHCDLLLLRHQSNDPDYADLVQIHQNTNRAASLVGQLLAFSRKQTLKPETLDPGDVIADLTHLLNRLVGARVHLRLEVAEEVGPIRADRRQLEQVLMNLVVNARDAMPEGGQISVSVRPCRLGAPLRRDRASVPAGEYALIVVADEGVGIPPERIEKIFEPFFTTKRPGEGTGLGLSTAYGIVKQTGGFIFVDSTPGKGARFSSYLPVNRDRLVDLAPQPAQPATGVAGPRPGQGVVLLVEDEAPVRAFATRALRMRGFSVMEADCAETALELLGDGNLRIDVIVTDVIMPGLDGPAWVRRALVDRPGTRVVFISGYTDEHFEAEQTAIPNSAFLPKPFSLGDLIRVVQGAPH
jgi:two-component system cell cycle sensor histidine kinase/response regulator CckA